MHGFIHRKCFVVLIKSLQQLIRGLTYQVSSSQVLVNFLLELLSSKNMGL